MLCLLACQAGKSSEVLRGVVHANTLHQCVNHCDDFTLTLDSTQAVINIEAPPPIVLSDNEHVEVVGTRISCGGCTTFSVQQLTELPPLSVPEHPLLPTTAGLQQNFPNPFNPRTSIRYILSSEGIVSLSIVNLVGETVSILMNESKQLSGEYTVNWDAGSRSSGIYFVRLGIHSLHNERNEIFVRPMLLLR